MTRAFIDVTAATDVAPQYIAVGMACGLVDYAASQGANRAKLLAAAGLTGLDRLDPNRRVPLASYIALMRAAAAACDDPAFAVHFAAATNFADLSIVGLISYASETMRDALVQMNRFGRLVTDIAIAGRDRFTLTEEADGLWLTDHRIDFPPFPELAETTFVRMVTGTRQFGDTPFVSRVEFAHADRGTARALTETLGAPVFFEAGRNAMRVSRPWQDYRIALYPRYAFALFCDHADQLLADIDAQQTMRGQVERLVLPILHRGSVAQPDVAAQLGLSEQALYRALRAEGSTFEAVVAALRHRFAQSYLRAGKISLKEIAYLLGYSDVSAFSRAFNRREGMAPGTFRRAQQVDGSP